MCHVTVLLCAVIVSLFFRVVIRCLAMAQMRYRAPIYYRFDTQNEISSKTRLRALGFRTRAGSLPHFLHKIPSRITGSLLKFPLAHLNFPNFRIIYRLTIVDLIYFVIYLRKKIWREVKCELVWQHCVRIHVTSFF